MARILRCILIRNGVVMRTIAAAVLLAALHGAAWSATPAEILKGVEAQARAAAGFAGFSAQRGAQFFNAKHGNEWSCASCHTADPKAAGRHARTSKDITPLSPLANPQRFTDAAKVEKWFNRNCNDVLGRTCTPQEKGDVVAWLLER